MGEGEGGAYPASRGVEAGPREIDGPAAEAGGGAGGTHGQAQPIKKQQPGTRGPVQGAGSQVRYFMIQYKTIYDTQGKIQYDTI